MTLAAMASTIEGMNMQHNCFFDIETIPTQSDVVRGNMLDAVKAPGNIKKPESIEKWLDENREAAAAERIANTSFDPAFGHICTISWAMNDDEPDVAHMESVEQERDVIGAFFHALQANQRYTFIGHYVGGFDIRFLLCRAVVLGLRIPQCIPRDPKPWDNTIFDTMTAWAGARGTISMDNLSEALGIHGKGGFTGADVAEAWANGEHHKIAAYCASDVTRTREIWRRFNAVGW
jgi:predicted PolB exonuclease-like 3'-5' exonuclease